MRLTRADAVQQALEFFAQHSSNLIIEDVVLKGREWRVTVSVGVAPNSLKNIRIDAETGNILGFD